MTTTNVAVPQRIKSKSREELEHRILALEAANAKCGEAIDDAVAEAVAAERERCETALRNLATTAHSAVGFVGAANYPERQDEAHDRVDTALNKQLTAIRNGSAAKQPRPAARVADAAGRLCAARVLMLDKV